MIDTPTAAEAPGAYPVRVRVDYPETLSRLSTFFRIVLLIPVFIFVSLLGGALPSFGAGEGARGAGGGAAFVGGTVALAIWATIVLRGNIPRWLFNFQAGVNRFSTRAVAYALLLTDKYPAFEGDWVVDYDIDYPERLSRWKVLFWKMITSVLHFIILAFLLIAAGFVAIFAWFAILFTGRYPKGAHGFVTHVIRWLSRVTAYVQSLTDAFPPYTGDEHAGPGSKSSERTAAVIGGLVLAAAVAAIVAGVIVLFMYATDSKSASISLAEAEQDNIPQERATLKIDDYEITLLGVRNDAGEGDAPIRPAPGKRLVGFAVRYRDLKSEERTFSVAWGEGGFNDWGESPSDIVRDTLRVQTGDGVEKPEFITFEGMVPPLNLDPGASGEMVAFFQVDDDTDLKAVRVYPSPENERHVAWKLE